VVFRHWTLGLALIALALGGLEPIANASSLPTISATAPCGVTASATYDHVVWILLENEGYSVVGSSSAPYLNALSSECGLATNYLAVGHPSLPNYIALTSGSTQGISSDGEPSEYPLTVPSIFSQLGENWRAYAESMPSSCDRVTSGTYAARHNPAVYYLPITAECRRHDVALTYPLNLGAKFTYIAPNVCDDMHSCAVATGDTWLSQFVPMIIASPQYQARSLVLFITFDENDTQAINRVPTFVIAPSVPRGERVLTSFTHYSLLRTSEMLLHLPLLGAAQHAHSMVASFHL
jgi:phosphatidylinositol-3-phosphatase